MTCALKKLKNRTNTNTLCPMPEAERESLVLSILKLMQDGKILKEA
jgi:hypothetical protein